MARKATKKQGIDKPRKRCGICGGDRNMETEYYKSKSILNKFDGLLSVCKACVEGVYDTLLKEYKYHKVAVYHLCMLLDVPWSEAIYSMSKSQGENQGVDIYKLYFQKINSIAIRHNVSDSFRTSDKLSDKGLDDEEIIRTNDLRENLEKILIEVQREQDKDFSLTREVIDRWGRDLDSIEDYIYLEQKYQDLISNYVSDTPIQRMLYQEIAQVSLIADKARRENNTNLYEKMLKVWSTLMNDANIKPVQETGAASDKLATWGEWVRKIEEEEPIPEASPEFQDVDGIGKYIQKWFAGHLGKMLGSETTVDDNSYVKGYEEEEKEKNITEEE